MDSPNLVTRVLAPLLPLIAIALIFGAAGYAFTEPSRQPVPPLPAADDTPPGVLGVLRSVSSSELALTTDDGSRLEYSLAGDLHVEVLRPIDRSEISAGDWLNGGAIPHPQTVLALVDLILIPDPEVEP